MSLCITIYLTLECRLPFPSYSYNNIPTFPLVCECNGHANDCTSENPEEGAQCIDCQHNTEGNNCEMCQIGFYENTEVLFTDPNICIGTYVYIHLTILNTQLI